MRETSPEKIEQRKIVAHSIMLFFAMEKVEQEQYLPAIDPEVKYVWDGDTGDKTKYPAYYFSFRAMDYLSVFPPRSSPTVWDMIYEMRELLNLMATMSPDPPFDLPYREQGSWSDRFFILWLFGPPYTGVGGSGDILWGVLRRYARLILADPRWVFDYPLLSFEEIRKYFTVHT